MSETLERAAEVTKLARLLGVETKELAYLERLPADSLREFRLRATDRLFDGDAGRLRRVASASKLVPVPLTVKISQLAFGPVLCAATAGLLDPAHAVKIATRCPTSFLADITVHLDPRRAADVIAAVPSDLVAAVAVELIERGEHVTTGRFVSYLSSATLRSSIAAIKDDADLLRVAFVMEGKDNLDELIDIARDRLPGIVRTAYEQDLWPEALDLIGHVSLAQLAKIAEVTTAEGDDVLTALVRAAHDNDAWDALLPVTAAMTPESLERFATLPAVREDEVLRRIVQTAVAGPGWVALLPLTTRLPADVRARVAAQVAELDDATLERLATEAHDSKHWDALLPIALAFDDDARRRLAGLPLLQREDVLAAAIETAARNDLWDAALPLVEALPEAAKPLIGPIVAGLKLPAAKREALVEQARAAGYADIVASLTSAPTKKAPAKRTRSKPKA